MPYETGNHWLRSQAMPREAAEVNIVSTAIPFACIDEFVLEQAQHYYKMRSTGC